MDWPSVIAIIIAIFAIGVPILRNTSKQGASIEVLKQQVNGQQDTLDNLTTTVDRHQSTLDAMREALNQSE